MTALREKLPRVLILHLTEYLDHSPHLDKERILVGVAGLDYVGLQPALELYQEGLCRRADLASYAS